jgi:hypothetical protein
MKKTGLKNAIGLAAFSVVITGVTPVFAGFEWRQPVEQAAPASPQPSQPSIQWGDAPPMPAQKVQTIEAAPIEAALPAPIPVTPPADVHIPVPLAPPAFPAANTDVITGFGKDLPLSVALQQIVPEGYTFSFAPGVDRDQNVSWQGDKPWKQVMTDMLGMQGLGFTMNDRDIVIQSMTPAAPPPVSKANMIPQDMIDWEPVIEETAPPVAMPQPSAPQEPVTIRREKPASLIDDILREDEKPNTVEPVAPPVIAKEETIAPMPPPHSIPGAHHGYAMEGGRRQNAEGGSDGLVQNGARRYALEHQL